MIKFWQDGYNEGLAATKKASISPADIENAISGIKGMGEIKVKAVMRKIYKLHEKEAERNGRVAVRDEEAAYNELPEEQKQAFDHCIDLGQIKEAREILVEHERSKWNESSHKISRK